MSRILGSLAALLLVAAPLRAGELDDELAPKKSAGSSVAAAAVARPATDAAAPQCSEMDREAFDQAWRHFGWGGWGGRRFGWGGWGGWGGRRFGWGGWGGWGFPRFGWGGWGGLGWGGWGGWGGGLGWGGLGWGGLGWTTVGWGGGWGGWGGGWCW